MFVCIYVLFIYHTTLHYEMTALREKIKTMQTSLDAANGKIRQLETPAEDPRPAEDATPGTYFDRTRVGSAAPSPIPSMARPRNQRSCEEVPCSLAQSPDSEMLDPDRGATHRRQPQTDEDLLREKVRVATGVLEQLAGSRVLLRTP